MTLLQIIESGSESDIIQYAKTATAEQMECDFDSIPDEWFEGQKFNRVKYVQKTILDALKDEVMNEIDAQYAEIEALTAEAI